MAGMDNCDRSVFASVGIFVRERLLPAATSTALTERALAAVGEPGVVGVEGGAAVARDARRVDTIEMADRWSVDLDRRFAVLRPEMETYFGLPLDWMEPITVLRYREGDFYRAHRDRVRSLDAFYRTRRVSAVLFVNDASYPPGQGGFTGGALRFHGLGGPSGSMALDVQPRAGTFIAFRSEILHEVRPVTAGERITAVAWYHASQASPSRRRPRAHATPALRATRNP